MKNRILVLLSLAAICGAVVGSGCSTTVSTAVPALGGAPAVTNVVTTTKGIDPATLAQINTSLSNIVAQAPAVIADVQAVKALVNSTPVTTTTATPVK